MHRHPLTRRPARPAPLSSAQARLWYLAQSRPPSPEYNLQVALLLRGHLDLPALLAALGTVVRRHEPLRTVVGVDAAGKPVQLVRPADAVPVDLTAARVSDGGTPHERASAVAAAELGTVFDLGAVPPLRVRVATVGRDAAVLVLTMHHLAFDGWSTPILLGELQEAYRSALRRKRPEFAPLPVTYSDYAWWEHERPAGQDAALLDFWRAELDGARDLALSDHAATSGVGGPTGTIRTPVDPRTDARARELAAQERTTPFAVAVAAYWALLARHCGERDFVVGTPVAGRVDLALEPLVGCFVNTVCLRARVDPRAPFRELVRAARTAISGALAHQELPFDELVRRVAPDRAADRNPLFRAFCSAVDGIPADLNLPGLDAEFLPPATGPSRFDLNATFLFDREEPLVQLDHSRTVLSDDAAAGLAGQLSVLLDWAVVRPDRAVGELRSLRPAQRREVLALLNPGTPA